jgi:AAA family ATP:ADP antiporter
MKADESSPVGRGSVKKGVGILRIFSDIRPGESATALILLADIFILLASYYIIKVVREPLVLISAEKDMGILMASNLPEWLKDILRLQGGPQLKAAAAACQALLLVGFIPLFSWFASRVKRIRFLTGVNLFFISNIILFYILSLAKVPFLGFYFYVWVGIFNNSLIALFWSFANDLYTQEKGHRLFPVIAIGATAGAPVGSAVAGSLKNLPPFQTILLTTVLLGVFLGLALLAHVRESKSRDPESPCPPVESRVLNRGSGFKYVFGNRYVLLVGLLLLILNIVNTSGEFILSDFVRNSAALAAPGKESSVVQSFYGNFNLLSSLLAFLLQAFLVSRIVKHAGLRGVLLILPVLAFGAYGLIGIGAGLGLVKWLKIGENATDYSIMNTGKAMLWLPTAREEKYKAKQTVDTFFVRMGDFAAALLFIAGTTLLGFGVRAIAAIVLLLVAVWLVVTFRVLKRHDRLAPGECV